MDLREYARTLRKRWLDVTIALALAMGTSLAVSLLATPQFEATTRLFFAVQGGESVTDLAQGSSFTERQMGSYAQVATSPLVLEPVIAELDLDTRVGELASQVRASVPLNTVILQITALSQDPDQAAEIANAVGAQLADTVGRLSPERPDGAQAVLATTLTPALSPDTPASPKALQNLALGLVLGATIGVAVALVHESFDTRIRSLRDLGLASDRAVLGAVGFDASAKEHPLIEARDRYGRRAEAMRRLRTNLQFVSASGSVRAVVVTSSVPGEGKTTTAANLALTLSDSGLRVILVDGDLRRPSVGELMGLEQTAGLTTVLIGQADLRDVIQPWGADQLDVLASGPVPPNPSELLGSPAMAEILAELRRAYDVVVIDSPPLLPVTDGAILAKMGDGTLIVVGAGRTRREELRSALAELDSVGAPVLGVVLNKIRTREMSYRGYGYTYEQGDGGPGRSADSEGSTYAVTLRR